MKERLSFSNYVAIGMMLFALFFGAGNLIFPAGLGLEAGTSLWPAVTGFLITGVGLPLLGILAIGFSGSRNLQELASRISPAYAVLFTSLLYLTIGPFFASPRTATVAYEVGITPFLSEGQQQVGLVVFTSLFFAVTLLFSLNPVKLVDHVGKLLAPGIVILLSALIFMVIANPPGVIQSPAKAYIDNPFITGFLDGYTQWMPSLPLYLELLSLMPFVPWELRRNKKFYVQLQNQDLIAVILLGCIYVGIAYMGATGAAAFGIVDGDGGTLLNNMTFHYFRENGLIMLAILIILACLTTAIGLTTACAEYFHTLFPKYSYTAFVIFFSALTFIIANFGLTNIITFSIPVLMFLYPLAIVLILLAFLSPLFNHARFGYIATTIATFLISLFDGLKSLCTSLEIDYFGWMVPIITFYEKTLPMYSEGLGWLLPALILITITTIVVRIRMLFKVAGQG